jgi:hypothetical protein
VLGCVPRHHRGAVRGRLALWETKSVELTIRVPAALADPAAAERARLLLVLDGVRHEKMTWRAAAAALDIAPDQLLDLARDHGLRVVRYEASDLRDDLATRAKLEHGRTSGA